MAQSSTLNDIHVRWEAWRARIFEIAPSVFAAVGFLAGLFTIVAVATPALPRIRGLDGVERFISELPEISASLAGLALMGLATGLRKRVDTAWAFALALLTAVCLYAALRHGHVVAASSAGAAALALALTRKSFFRHSRLGELTPDSRVALAIAAAFGRASRLRLRRRLAWRLWAHCCGPAPARNSPTRRGGRC